MTYKIVSENEYQQKVHDLGALAEFRFVPGLGDTVIEGVNEFGEHTVWVSGNRLEHLMNNASGRIITRRTIVSEAV